MKKTLKNKKGFTLIEIVIVIVIIAILAAILVPSMLAWIDSANEKTAISAADTIRNTIAAEMIEIYKDGVDVDGTQTNSCYDADFWQKVSDKVGKQVQGSNPDADSYVTFTVVDGSITEMSYTTRDYKAIYKDDAWTVE